MRMPSSNSPFSKITEVVKSHSEESPGVVRSLQEMMDAIQQQKAVAQKEGYTAGYAIAKDEGYQVGYKSGYEAGRIQGKEIALQEEQVILQEQQAVLQRLHAEIDRFVHELQLLQGSVEQKTDEWYANAEEQFANLGVVIAEKILHQELKLSRDSILAIVREVLEEVRSGTSIKLRVNPYDTALIDAHKEKIIDAASNIREIEIISDSNIPAGVIIESNSGVIDARVDMMLTKIVDTVKSVGSN